MWLILFLICFFIHWVEGQILHTTIHASTLMTLPKLELKEFLKCQHFSELNQTTTHFQFFIWNLTCVQLSSPPKGNRKVYEIRGARMPSTSGPSSSTCPTSNGEGDMLSSTPNNVFVSSSNPVPTTSETTLSSTDSSSPLSSVDSTLTTDLSPTSLETTYAERTELSPTTAPTTTYTTTLLPTELTTDWTTKATTDFTSEVPHSTSPTTTTTSTTTTTIATVYIGSVQVMKPVKLSKRFIDNSGTKLTQEVAIEWAEATTLLIQVAQCRLHILLSNNTKLEFIFKAGGHTVGINGLQYAYGECS